MATYRIPLAESGYPRGSQHLNAVRQIRSQIDQLRFDLLCMQKHIGNNNPSLTDSYAGIVTAFGVQESSSGAGDNNQKAKDLYDNLVGFFSAWDASTADNCRGYLGLVG